MEAKVILFLLMATCFTQINARGRLTTKQFLDFMHRLSPSDKTDAKPAWAQKSETNFLITHITDTIFNVSSENRNFIVRIKDLQSWLSFTTKPFVFHSNDIQKEFKFISVYTNLYKYLYNGTIKIIHGDSYAQILTDFEALGQEVNALENFDDIGSCNLIEVVYKKFINSSIMFIFTTMMPNKYYNNKLFSYIKPFPNLRMIFLSNSTEWDKSKYHFVTIENVTVKHSFNRIEAEFLPLLLSRSEFFEKADMEKSEIADQFLNEYKDKYSVEDYN